MKILHYYPDEASGGMIAAYVSILCDEMGSGMVNDRSCQQAEACHLLRSRRYDILHLHGCWYSSAYRVCRQAVKSGTRIVLTPHGQLEPWVIGERYWKEKLPKKVLFQRHLVAKAYAVIIQGKMEEECMRRLAWNMRTVIVRNSLITQTISGREMARQTAVVYRQVMDSNTFQLMTPETRHTLRQLVKAGITGDVQWLREPCISITDAEQWRYVFCYARQEQIADIVNRGISILRLDAPSFDNRQSICFVPDDYEPAQSVGSVIGMHFVSENERLVATFRYLRKLITDRRLTVAHLVELDRELREHVSDEDQLCEELRERNLFKTAARIMQLTHELTGLDEGYMPMPPVNDRITRTIRKHIANHLAV